MTVNQSVSGQLSVLVSQPGGSFVTLIPNTAQSAASAQRSLHRLTNIIIIEIVLEAVT